MSSWDILTFSRCHLVAASFGKALLSQGVCGEPPQAFSSPGPFQLPPVWLYFICGALEGFCSVMLEFL